MEYQNIVTVLMDLWQLPILLEYFKLFYKCIVNNGYHFHQANSPTRKNNDPAETDWTATI